MSLTLSMNSAESSSAKELATMTDLSPSTISISSPCAGFGKYIPLAEAEVVEAAKVSVTPMSFYSTDHLPLF